MHLSAARSVQLPAPTALRKGLATLRRAPNRQPVRPTALLSKLFGGGDQVKFGC
jgi:hypothetical protein